MLIIRLFLSALVAAVTLTLVACSRGGEGESIPTGRLPAIVEPLHYQLALSIDPREAQFAGETQIRVRLDQAQDSIWLHGNRLQVSELNAQLPGGETIAGHYEQVADVGVARLSFETELPAGELTLQFRYSAPFNTNLEGLYKVSAGGEDYAFTQFQATSARLAFPGFDEPGFKVPFDISLEVDAEHVAVSSTPVLEEEQLANGNKRLRFATTKPLPTYLIAFAVGPMEAVAGEPLPATALRDSLIPFTAYAVQGKGEQLKFALQNTHDIVLNQERYFGYPYPFAKIGLIAVPDFAAGAMENVGAITYREQYLLQGPSTPAELQQRFLLIHAHELAHQWFGNLVTPHWWDDIWLNEAFATWMASKTMQQLDPDGGYRQRMLQSALNTMAVDSLVSTRQIRQPVDEHAEIGAAFDGITYQKGSAVLTMFEGFVGEADFQAGIQNYMQGFAFANADARDFVQAIAAASEAVPAEQVEAAFFSFLEQPGIPLLQLAWDCEEGRSRVQLGQSRYLPVGSEGDASQQWHLPICLAYEEEGERREHCQVLSEARASIELNTSSCPDYLIPNADATGYYRWNFSPDRWQRLLASDALNERERLAAASSLSGAFHAATLSAADYLGLLPALLQSDNAQVLMAPLEDLYLIDEQMLGSGQQAAFRSWLGDLYRPVLEQVSLDKNLEDADQLRLRSRMLEVYALKLQEPALRQELLARVRQYLGTAEDGNLDTAALDPNIRQVALASAAQQGDQNLAALLLEHLQNSDDAVLREQLLRALSYSQVPAVRERLRELTLGESLRDNELVPVLESLLSNPDSRAETWDWLRENFDTAVSRYPSWFQGRIIENAAHFCSRERQQEIQQELGDKLNQLQRGPRSLALTLEQIQLCAALVEEQGESVREMF